jgi:hypothetical protein
MSIRARERIRIMEVSLNETQIERRIISKK